ncbi:unnamed protein product [Dovyalis caffra]|uniref:Ribosomal protein S19 n=1 Tax=Dovyalis caffra TaxID=77055 RepID=A0AAV1QLB1_9ROSI|nr:unnamed protein product [Dovyalis caffra]
MLNVLFTPQWRLNYLNWRRVLEEPRFTQSHLETIFISSSKSVIGMAFCNKFGNLVRQSISQNGQVPVATKLNSIPCMPLTNLFSRGFASGQPFIDAFLFRLKQKKASLSNRKIWSRRSTILPEYINSSVRIYNGKTFVRVKINEGKVGHKFGEFAFTRKRRIMQTKVVKGKKK